MNLFTLVNFLSQNNGKNFTTKELLTLAFAVFADERVYKSVDPLRPNSPYSEINRSQVISERTQELIQLKMSTCKNCSRCESRTNVVLPDGYYDADVFIISDYPDILDDRTSIPLSGASEAKSSNCVVCQNFRTCYGDFSNLFPIPCEFKPGIEKEETDYYLGNLSDEDLNTSGKPLMTILTKLQNSQDNSLLSFRKSWDVLLDRTFTDLEARKDWRIRPKVYITNLVKCLSENQPTDDETNECYGWLRLERKLCKSPTTLVLGEFAFNVVSTYAVGFPREKTFEELSSTGVNGSLAIDTEPWGRLVVAKHPRDIINSKTSRADLADLEKKIKYCLDQASGKTTLKESEEEVEDSML